METITTQITNINQCVIEAKSRFCRVPTDINAQLLCKNFLYNNIQTHCTFKRFGDLGMCDFTPQGYANVVSFNAAVAKRKQEGK